MTGFDPKTYKWAGLVPEIFVENLAASLEFWTKALGFRRLFARPRFAYLDHNGAQVMLWERGPGEKWETAKMVRPFGRGVNFQVETNDLNGILRRLKRENWPLYEAPYEKQRTICGRRFASREFLVQDPDGYLIRFAEEL